MRVLPGRKSLLCVNVMKNSFICQNNVNLLHFVPLNPPLGQMCYKDVLVSRHLVLPLRLSLREQGVNATCRLPFFRRVRVEKAYILMTGPLLLNNSEEGRK